MQKQEASSDNLKNVVIISPCLTMGGMERASSNIANAFSKKGLEVHYVVLLKQEKFFSLEPRIRFYEPPDFNTQSLSILKTCKWLRQTIKKIHPDIILCYGQFYSAISILALVGTGMKVVISERSSPLLKWPLKQRAFNKGVFSLFKPRGILAQTQIAAHYQQKYYGTRQAIKVIPNALKSIKHYPECTREKQILAVGRFNDSLKGFDRLLEAFALLKAKDWKLVFAGGDENGQTLKEQASQLKILDRIVFLGKVKELDKVYAQAGIFVIPSRSEGFPNALCEAMAAGLPCISFDFIAGPRDIITDEKDGLLVENGNIKALANKIQFLIDHEEERIRIGQEATKIAKRLHIDQISKMHYDFLNGLYV